MMTPRKNNLAFLVLLHFWNLWNKKSTSHGKKEKMCLGLRFFALKFGTVQDFLTSLDMSCISVGVAKF